MLSCRGNPCPTSDLHHWRYLLEPYPILRLNLLLLDFCPHAAAVRNTLFPSLSASLYPLGSLGIVERPPYLPEKGERFTSVQ
jgi:hypothetical protein